MNPQANLSQAVREFMTAGEMTTNVFNARQACLYTGLQLEEMAEKIEAVSTGSVTFADADRLTRIADQIRILGIEFKQGKHMGDILRADREALIDADIDLAWVSVGAAFSTASDTDGAIAEVARANLSKFPNGVVTRDANGKISKPAGWRGPDLSPFFVPAER